MRQAAAHSACAHAPARGTHRQPATEGLLRRKLGSRGVPASDEQAAARLCLALVRSRRSLACGHLPPGSGPRTATRTGQARGARCHPGGASGGRRGDTGLGWTAVQACPGSRPPWNGKPGPRGGASEAGRAGGGERPGPPGQSRDPGSAPPGPSLLTPTQTTASRWRQGAVPPLHRPSCAPSPHPGFLDHPLRGQW